MQSLMSFQETVQLLDISFPLTFLFILDISIERYGDEIGKIVGEILLEATYKQIQLLLLWT